MLNTSKANAEVQQTCKNAPPTLPLTREPSDDDLSADDEGKPSGSTKDKIPPVYNKRRGSKRLAMALARDP